MSRMTDQRWQSGQTMNRFRPSRRELIEAPGTKEYSKLPLHFGHVRRLVRTSPLAPARRFDQSTQPR